ncbi:hypothetical protein [Sphingopyxis sp.]|uniref:hypothetical protein n=1 Tax=Sphingopyxis sp. TaxID=1908224 RepID=UPI002DE2FECF|nr:hypothetical protein [Sphingopyxis sp.]
MGVRIDLLNDLDAALAIAALAIRYARLANDGRRIRYVRSQIAFRVEQRLSRGI